MSPVQSRILEIIERKRTATVSDLSSGVGITKPAVQYHIKSLIRHGHIEIVLPPKNSLSRGRPEKHYRLSDDQRPDHYCGLAQALIVLALENEEPFPKGASPAQMMARQLAGDPGSLENNPFIKRMSTAMDRLEAMNYQPRWEVHANGVRVHLRNCPYAKLAIQYPLLCEMDKYLLVELLDVPVSQELAWRDTPHLTQDCIFFFTR